MKVEQAKSCFLWPCNACGGGECDGGLAGTSGVKAAAQHNPAFESIDPNGTVGCGIKCLSATLRHGGGRD
jgi:hypothetical protein